tara:strand:+ start:895 stop:1353 length:459 start_codon:yes stop_codon:yes gene_type:complete
MASWAKLSNYVQNETLPLTIGSVTSVSSKFVNTRENNTVFFRWHLKSTQATHGMKVDVSLISSYGGEMITLATATKHVLANTTDELLVQFSPNVPGGTLANNADRITLGMGNPNYLGENTFSVLQFSHWDNNASAGGGGGQLTAVECYVMQE